MEYDARITVEAGVTFVAVRVRADAPERVRVVNELDGPVWPPRTNGVPDHGWTDHGYETTVEPDAPVALGYATPAPPREPAVSVTAADGDLGTEPNPARDLPDPRPPRDAVPAPVPEAVTAWLDDVESSGCGREARRVLARAARLSERVDE